MPKIMRGSPVYWNGKKIAEIQKSSYQLKGNVTQEIGAEGFYGNSLGPVLSTLKLDCSIPVEGMTTRLLPQQNGKLGVIADGKMHVIEATVNDVSYESDFTSGKNSGSFDFTGGAPAISG